MIARLQHTDHGGGQPVDDTQQRRGGVQAVIVTVGAVTVGRGGDVRREVTGCGREVIERLVGCWWLLMWLHGSNIHSIRAPITATPTSVDNVHRLSARILVAVSRGQQ
jgi:hypothetical protein